MPAYLTDFAEGSKAIADAQQSALQYQYAPQQAAVKNNTLNSEASIKADEAIEKRLKIESLQESYKADTEISSKLAEIYGKNPDTEPADALTSIVPHLKGKAQLTAIEKLPGMQRQQAEAQAAKYARQQQRQDVMYSRVADIPPSELPSAILGMIQDKTMSPEEGQQATQIIAKVGAEEAQRIFRKMHTTDAMRRTEVIAAAKAEEARHNQVKEDLRHKEFMFRMSRVGASTSNNNDTKNALAERRATLQELNGMRADRNALARFFKDNPTRPEPDEAWFGNEIKNQDDIDDWDSKEARLKTLEANIEMGQEILKQTNPLLSPADKKKEKERAAAAAAAEAAAKPAAAKPALDKDEDMPDNVKSQSDWEAAKATLINNNTPANVATFDLHFGAGAADKVLAKARRTSSGKIRN